jgi:putative phosphoribosyl transferase
MLRADDAPVSLRGRTVIVVDDGIATGATARAACLVARAHGATRVVLAAPVGSRRAVEDLRSVADEVVCLETPDWFAAVGQVYRDFSQVPDAEVTRLLALAARRTSAGAVPHPRVPADARGIALDVVVDAGTVHLAGDLDLPPRCRGMVVFAHGSGSSRRSPRNQHVARLLNRAGLGTLVLDLLTPAEEGNRRLVFDVELLAERLAGATRWWRSRPEAGRMPVGYFGASTGAAAALWAAADPDLGVGAVVSRGGRPDLAAPRLADVEAPTLLIVGGRDEVVLDLNQRALLRLCEESELVVVPGATHLFEEPGALDRVAELATGWFGRHLVLGSRPTAVV